MCLFEFDIFRMYANMHLWLVFSKMFNIFLCPCPVISSHSVSFITRAHTLIIPIQFDITFILCVRCQTLPAICKCFCAIVMLCINVEWNANNFSLNPPHTQRFLSRWLNQCTWIRPSIVCKIGYMANHNTCEIECWCNYVQIQNENSSGQVG